MTVSQNQVLFDYIESWLNYCDHFLASKVIYEKNIPPNNRRYVCLLLFIKLDQDRVLFDVIVLPEEDLFFLTDPKTPLLASSTRELGSDHDVTLFSIPESKLNYLYVEERRYSSASEGSEYGLWFVYKRDV